MTSFFDPILLKGPIIAPQLSSDLAPDLHHGRVSLPIPVRVKLRSVLAPVLDPSIVRVQLNHFQYVYIVYLLLYYEPP